MYLPNAAARNLDAFVVRTGCDIADVFFDIAPFVPALPISVPFNKGDNIESPLTDDDNVLLVDEDDDDKLPPPLPPTIRLLSLVNVGDGVLLGSGLNSMGVEVTVVGDDDDVIVVADGDVKYVVVDSIVLIGI